jgi:hypothetical protein
VRRDAAKAAAPYLHPRLSSSEISGKDGKPIPVANITVPADPHDAAALYKSLMG